MQMYSNHAPSSRCFFNKVTYARSAMVNVYFQILFLDSNPQWHFLDVSYIAIPDVKPCCNSVLCLTKKFNTYNKMLAKHLTEYLFNIVCNYHVCLTTFSMVVIMKNIQESWLMGYYLWLSKHHKNKKGLCRWKYTCRVIVVIKQTCSEY